MNRNTELAAERLWARERERERVRECESARASDTGLLGCPGNGEPGGSWRWWKFGKRQGSARHDWSVVSVKCFPLAGDAEEKGKIHFIRPSAFPCFTALFFFLVRLLFMGGKLMEFLSLTGEIGGEGRKE